MRPFALLDQQASTEERILAAVSGLDPRQIGNRVAFQCPSCGAKGRTAYAYLNNTSGHWRCNRANECSAEGHFLARDGAGQSSTPKPKTPPSPPAQPVDQRSYGRIVRAGRGRLSSRAGAYLMARLPGFDPAGLEDFAKQIDAYDLSLIKARDLEAAGAKGLLRGGYELAVALRAMDTGQVVSLQGRAIGSVAPKAPKILSSKGGYGDSGACFGSLEKALEEAKDLGRLIVVEGLVDFLTARAAGVCGLVGVPGVGLAKRLAKELESRAWGGLLIVSLDGDDAGAAGLADITKALKDSYVEVETGRPSSGDINDIWRAAAERGGSGAEAVRAHFEGILRRSKFNPLEALPDVRVSKIGKARARQIFSRNFSETHSALRSLGTTGACGALSLLRRRISDGDRMVGQIKSFGVPVCERQSCAFCRRQNWLHIVRHAEEQWPEDVAMVKVEIADRMALERFRARLSKLSREAVKEGGNGYLTSMNPATGLLVVVATVELALLLAAKIGEFETVSRRQALCELAPCFVGAASLAVEKLNDSSAELEDIEGDEWISKVLRWASTSGEAFKLPDSEELRDAVRAEARARTLERLKAKEGAGERVEEQDSGPAPRGSVDIYCYSDGLELVAVSLAPLSLLARLAVLERRPIDGLDPSDPGNLLDNPDIAGPAVGKWVRDFYRHHMGRELEPRGRGEDRPPRGGPISEDLRWGLMRPLVELQAIVKDG